MAPQDGQVEGLGVGARVGPELLEQRATEALVGSQGGARLPGPVMGHHDRPVRLLVVGVGGHGRGGPLQGAGVVSQLQRRPPSGAPAPAQQALGLPLGRLRPDGIRLVLQNPAPPEQGQALEGGGAGQGRFSGGEPGLGLVHQMPGLVQVDPKAGAGHDLVATGAAGMASAPSRARSRLTRVAMLASRWAGGSSPQRTSAMVSMATAAPRCPRSSLSRVHPLRLPSSAGGMGAPSVETAKGPSRWT